MFLRISNKLHLNVTERLLLGRLFVLSNYSQTLVTYSDADAKRDDFTERKLAYALRNFEKLGLIEMKKARPRTLKVNIDPDSADLFLNVPIKFLKEKNINLTSTEKLLLGRLYLLSIVKGNDFIYSDKKAQEELLVPLRTVKRAFAGLRKLKLISTSCHLDGKEIKYRTIKVNIEQVNLPAQMALGNDKVALGNKNLPAQMTPPSCINDTTLTAQMALSSSINEHINEHINEIRAISSKKAPDIIYPKNIEECAVYFENYVQKYKDTIPLLSTVDLTQTIISFFDYYSSRNWHDSKNKPVKDVAKRVSTWLGNTNLSRLPKKQEKPLSTNYSEAVKEYYKRTGVCLDQSAMKEDSSIVDVEVEEVKDENNSFDFDDLPF